MKRIISGLIIFAFGFPVLVRLLIIPSFLNLVGLERGNYLGDGILSIGFLMFALPIISLSIALVVNLFGLTENKIPPTTFLRYYFLLTILFILISITVPI
jgi:hypothetical protein